MNLPIVVVGAGAAGLLAAIFAAGKGRRVVLLERTKDGGRKILISGGGRCNILPSELDPSRYVTASSTATMRNILRSWPLADQRRFFEKELGLTLVLEPETGKLFPSTNRARDVRDGLVSLARRRGVEVRFDSKVTDVTRAGDAWRVHLEGGEALDAAAVILTTGGLSVPATGSDGIGLAIARRLGHSVNETYPALTPLTADPPVHAPLAGISPVVTIEAPGTKFRTTGGFLFTHRGYSGPSVLDVSHLAVRSRLAGEHQAVLVQWTDLDTAGWEAIFSRGGTGTVANVVRKRLPERLADALLAEAGVPDDRTLSHLGREERKRLVPLLARYPLPWTGDEGYRKAEVTGGGVALGEIDPRTMESRLHPGLYLAGELLDAFGPIGGYNFVWAWVTGRAAGIACSVV
ncbi:MAG TPA: aminoacetone oxidase family FAD-binding enzyme [Gemmatimonadales bacterium]